MDNPAENEAPKSWGATQDEWLTPSGSFARDYKNCPKADDLDLDKARKLFPMSEDLVKGLESLKPLAGLTHEVDLLNYIKTMEKEFTVFSMQMRTKFRTLKTLVGNGRN